MLSIALPKGRLLCLSLKLFQEIGCTGLVELLSSRRLFWEDPEQRLGFMLVRPWDVPIYVEYGSADLGDENLHLCRSLRVATKYPHLARQHFLKQGIWAEVVSLSGSVELAPQVGLADLIVDVVDTGRTLRENNLVEIEEFMSSEACLIVNRASHKLKLREISDLMERIAGVIGAHV